MRRSPAFLLAFAAVLALFAPGAPLATALSADGTIPSADGVPVRYHAEGSGEERCPGSDLRPLLVLRPSPLGQAVDAFVERYRVVLDLAGLCTCYRLVT
jgi:hypothetical protein